MKKVFLWLLVISLIAVFSLAGCKEETAAEEEVAEEEVAEEEVAEEEVAEEEVAEEEAVDPELAPYLEANIDWRQFEGTTLNIVATSTVHSDAYLPTMGLFEKLTGMTVNYQTFEDTDRLKKQVVDYSSGTGEFDIGNVGFTNREMFAEPGYLEVLTKYLDDPKLTDKEWYDLEDISESLINAGVSKAGDLVDLTFSAEYLFFWYRMDIFDQLGLTCPETWDEWIETLEVLDNARKAGEIEAYAHCDRTMAGGSESGWSMFAAASRQNIKLVDFDKKISYMNTPKGIEFMKFYTGTQLKYGPPGAFNWTWSDIATAFQQGQIAMSPSGNSQVPMVEDPEKSEVAGKVGYSHSILKDGGKEVLWQWGWGINADSKNKEAAWLWVEWATSRPLMAQIAPDYLTPVRATSFEDPGFLAAIPNQTYADACAWMVEKGLNQNPDLLNPDYTEVGDIITKEMTNVIGGIKDAETACADADAGLVSIGYTSGE